MRRSSIAYRLILALVLLLSSAAASAHDGFIPHSEEAMEVFGFEHNTKLLNRGKNRENSSWLKFINSDMIDQTEFHRELDRQYPGLSLRVPTHHRLLFHWGMNARPWSTSLENYLKKCCGELNLDTLAVLPEIQAKLVEEQRRRNKLILNRTAEVFGFSTAGKERSYAMFFAAMAYNVHLLGDYMSDNSVLDGLLPLRSILSEICRTIEMLDKQRAVPVVKKITSIDKDYSRRIAECTNPVVQKRLIQEEADTVMAYLKKSIPDFIKKAQEGSICRRLGNQGIKMK